MSAAPLHILRNLLWALGGLALAGAAIAWTPSLLDAPYIGEFPLLASLGGVFLVLTAFSMFEDRLRDPH